MCPALLKSLVPHWFRSLQGTTSLALDLLHANAHLLPALLVVSTKQACVLLLCLIKLAG